MIDAENVVYVNNVNRVRWSCSWNCKNIEAWWMERYCRYVWRWSHLWGL